MTKCSFFSPVHNTFLDEECGVKAKRGNDNRILHDLISVIAIPE